MLVIVALPAISKSVLLELIPSLGMVTKLVVTALVVVSAIIPQEFVLASLVSLELDVSIKLLSCNMSPVVWHCTLLRLFMFEC